MSKRHGLKYIYLLLFSIYEICLFQGPGHTGRNSFQKKDLYFILDMSYKVTFQITHSIYTSQSSCSGKSLQLSKHFLFVQIFHLTSNYFLTPYPNVCHYSLLNSMLIQQNFQKFQKFQISILFLQGSSVTFGNEIKHFEIFSRP